MRIKKSGGKIFGADLTAAERKAMDKEIQRQLAVYTEKHRLELDALLERYEMGEDDRLWLCTYMLKQIGVDIEKWDRERG